MGYARRRRPHTLVWVTVPPALVIQPLTLSRFAVNATSSRSGRNTSVTSYGRAFAICQTPFLGIAPGRSRRERKVQRSACSLLRQTLQRGEILSCEQRFDKGTLKMQPLPCPPASP